MKRDVDVKRSSRERRNIYIALEEVDMTWSLEEVKEFRRLWDEGVSLLDIAEKFDRKPLEVGILLIDQTEQEKVGKRITGVEGINGAVEGS